MRSRLQHLPREAPSSAFTGYWFPPEVIALAVRWYLRYGLSYRDDLLPKKWSIPCESHNRPMRAGGDAHEAQEALARADRPQAP
jgi:hypothetical protein